MKCSEMAGFLIPRPCRNIPVHQCALCQKWICTDHTVRLPDGAEACTACAASQNAGPAAEPYRIRNQYGGSDAWYYGWLGSRLAYTDRDYAAFEQRADLADAVESLEES